MPLLNVNGPPEQTPAPATLAGLIEALQLQGQRLAIEHNGQIVPRSLWSETRLAEQDQIEIVKAIGGG